MSGNEEQFGRYTLLDRIASGGMAEIFRARYSPGPDFSKIVVIKRILPSLADDEEFVTMFRDEARITVQLNHTNIVQVFDFGHIAGSYFLAMEYVRGANLSSVLRRCNPSGRFIPVDLSLLIGREIAKGLAYAHAQRDEAGQPLGIVHRDVSPSNVLISYEGEVKITDFGIAKAASRISGTQQGIVKGKLSYMAPEQIQKGSIDGRADVFALGVLLWECLAGTKLFRGDHVETMREIVFDQPDIDAPSVTNPAVTPDVDEIVAKALTWDRDDRYTADELHHALQGALQGRAGAKNLSGFMRKLFAREIEVDGDVARAKGIVETGKLHDIEASADAGATTREKLDDLIPLSERRLVQGRGTGQHTVTAPIQSLLETTKPETPRNIVKEQKTRTRLRNALIGVGVLALLALVIGVGQRVLFGPEPSPTPTEVADVSATATATATTTATATPVVVVSETVPPTTLPTTRRTPKPPVKWGYLSLQSDPWAEIYVDGKKLNKNTPSFGIKLKTGRRHVRLVNPLVHKEASFHIVIEEGKTLQKTVVLEDMDVAPQ